MNIMSLDFEGHAVHTFEWNGKPCWIATEIVSLFGYADASKTIQQCIEAEEFETGIEYDVLVGKALRQFKSMVQALTTAKVVSQNTRNLIIFYEDALYGFLQYTHKPIGVRFRKWIRSVVVPSIRQHGSYSIAGEAPAKLEPPKKRKAKSQEPALPTINNTARILMKAMEDANTPAEERLRVVAGIYRQAGVNVQLNPPALPAPEQSAKVVEMNRYSKEAFEACKDMSQEEIIAYLSEIMSMSAPINGKRYAIMMIEAARRGKSLLFN